MAAWERGVDDQPPQVLRGAEVLPLADKLNCVVHEQSNPWKKSTARMRWKWKKKRQRRLQRKRRKMRARSK